MTDLQVISLACIMEALGIDSENLLWSKLKTDYPGLFPDLKRLEHQSQAMVVDSIPVPVVKLARENTYKSFRKDFDTAPAKGYSAVNKGWFIGYKLHVVIFDNGVVQQSGVTKGNVHSLSRFAGISIF